MIWGGKSITKERKVSVFPCAEDLHRFTAPSLHRPSLHHRVREGNGQHCLKPTVQWSEQQRGREKRKTKAVRVEDGRARCAREKYTKTEMLLREAILSSGYPPSPSLLLSIPVTLFMALWLCDPCVSCHFLALSCHSPPDSHVAYIRGSTVVSGA